jgi:hypothetical protein
MELHGEEYLQNMRKYLENRQRYPLDQLAKYAGLWIAWKPDGTEIVGSAKEIDDLIQSLRASREDANDCIIEGITDDDSIIAGGFVSE